MTEAEYPGELLLVWKHPHTRRRYLIGRLWYDQDVYHFRYEQSVPWSLNQAIEDGFRRLDAFKDLDREYVSTQLFPTFSRRIRHAARNERIRDYVDASSGSAPSREMEILCITGGRMPTDSFEFLEAAERLENSYHFRFPVAGWRYYAGENVINMLIVGTPMQLELEPANHWDSNAIKVLSPSGVHVGYVPAVYSWYLDSAVKRGNFEARISSIGPAVDPQRRLCLDVTAALMSSDNTTRFRLVPPGFEAYAEDMTA